MKMRPHEFFCDIAPGCHYQAAIVVHPTNGALQKAYQGYDGVAGEVEAFCLCKEGKSDRLVTLHFCPKYSSPGVISHEVFHAVMELIRVLRLNMADTYAQEFAAHATTHLVQKSLKAVRISKKRKI
jgi:hypothetical protein